MKLKVKKTIFFLDDGPHEDVTPGLLSILQSLNVSATFFVVGWRLHLLAAIETMRRTHREVNFF